MPDNKLRCLLAYRLGKEPVVIAKYDHASQTETHIGESGTLYGGRDKDYADAVALVIGKDPPGQVNDSNKIGGFKVVQSDIHQVVYGADNDDLCLAVIVGLKYPSRVATQLLVDLYSQFSQKFGLQAKSATTNSLSKKAKSMFKSTCQKYADPGKADKTSDLIDKVDQVKSTMSDNISVMLKNTESADALAQQSEQLSESATVFKKKSTDLKKEMWWKDFKTTLLLIAVVIAVVLMIIIPIILKSSRQ